MIHELVIAVTVSVVSCFGASRVATVLAVILVQYRGRPPLPVFLNALQGGNRLSVRLFSSGPRRATPYRYAAETLRAGTA